MGDSPDFKKEREQGGDASSKSTSYKKSMEELKPIKRPASPDFDPTLTAKAKRQRSRSEDAKLSSADSPTTNSNHQNATGHRPVTSCTHCRQHKIKCNASENFPSPCSRCERMGLQCEIDPQFRPKKGSQLQNLRRDVDELKLKIEYLTRNESLIARALQHSNMGQELTNTLKAFEVSRINQLSINQPQKLQQRPLRKSIISKQNPDNNSTKISVQTYLASEPHLLQEGPKSSTATPPKDTNSIKSDSKPSLAPLLSDPTISNKEALPLVLQMALQRNTSDSNTPNGTPISTHGSPTISPMTSTYSSSRNKNEDNNNNDNIPNASSSVNDNPNDKNDYASQKKQPVVATTNAIPLLPSPYASIDEFVIGDVRLSIDKANELHHIFVNKYLRYFPILYSNSATELYSQSQLLFWTVMLTACLSDPEPSMYIKLSSLIKQLAIETCWIHTPRSTHISQALLILCIWPLPNQKILDDCSYRFVGLAKSLSYQLGLHRGEFISEFTRTQTSMPDAEKWRTRTWLGIFFSELCWASILGLPPTSQTDYLIENARMGQDEEDIDQKENAVSHGKHAKVLKETELSSHSNRNSNDVVNEAKDLNTDGEVQEDNKRKDVHSEGSKSNNNNFKLPRSFRRLICLASFQAKLCKVMGSSVVSPDGLMEPRDRASSLAILERELELLDRRLDFQKDTAVQIYHLYVKLMVCCFAFLPDTPTEDQSQYVTEAYLCATKVVTLLTSLLDSQKLIELPIYVRHSATFAALILFKLQLTPLLLNKYLDSARQSIVTIHRLYRNQLSAWATAVENDISRTASVLEKLNFVLITHPAVFVEEEGIITRMRSHLTDSLFYDLVWCIHEARRREMDPKYNEQALKKAAQKRKEREGDSSLDSLERKLYPLPFYNQISKEDFETIIKRTPGGTTVTTLVPTKMALKHAKKLAKTNKTSNGAIMEINGIPLSMLDETGSVNLENMASNMNQTYSSENHADLLSALNLSTTVQPASATPSSFVQPLVQPKTPELYVKPDGVNNDYASIPKSKFSGIPSSINDTSMQRSNSTPASNAKPAAPFSRMPPSSIPAKGRRSNPNSLFMMNNSLTSNLSLNKSMPLPSESLPASNLGNSIKGSNPGSYPNLNLFLNGGSPPGLNTGDTVNRPPMTQLSDLDTFFQQQSTGWIEGSSMNDDFLGWFDMNMEPEF